MKINSKVFLTLLAILIVVFPFQSVYSKQENPQEWVDVIIEGRRITATIGDVIAIGTLTSQDYCHFPAYTIEMGSNKPGYTSATLRATKDCKLIIFEINRQPFKKGIPPLPPEGDMQAPIDDVIAPGESETVNEIQDSMAAAVKRFGWARESFYEQFGITVTQTHSEMTYWDDGTKVYGGAEASPYCWWRSGTGWYLISCTKTKSFNGPSVVYLSVKGTYDHNIFQIWHRTTATFRAEPGGKWNKSCAFEGTMPPYWYTKCEGGSWVQ